jgi:hypothetical protein
VQPTPNQALLNAAGVVKAQKDIEEAAKLVRAAIAAVEAEVLGAGNKGAAANAAASVVADLNERAKKFEQNNQENIRRLGQQSTQTDSHIQESARTISAVTGGDSYNRLTA